MKFIFVSGKPVFILRGNAEEIFEKCKVTSQSEAISIASR